MPAGVGIIVHLSRVADEWPALLAALLVSTFVSMAVTALVMKGWRTNLQQRGVRRECDDAAHDRSLGLSPPRRRCSG